MQQWRMEKQRRRQFSWLPLIRGLLNVQNGVFSSPLMSKGHLTERSATAGRKGRARGSSCTVCVGVGSKASPARSLHAEQPHKYIYVSISQGKTEKQLCNNSLTPGTQQRWSLPTLDAVLWAVHLKFKESFWKRNGSQSRINEQMQRSVEELFKHKTGTPQYSLYILQIKCPIDYRGQVLSLSTFTADHAASWLGGCPIFGHCGTISSPAKFALENWVTQKAIIIF